MIGGGDLCEAAKYANFDNRDWFKGFFSQSHLKSVKEHFTDSSVIAGNTEAERVHGRLPLMDLPNDDIISLQLSIDQTITVAFWGTAR